MKTAVLTSFRRWHEAPIVDRGYSIAVYQPAWLEALPVTRVFDIRDERGKWIRPRDFVPDGHDHSQPNDALLARYRDALLGLYVARRRELRAFIDETPDVVSLCCWCPYDKAAKRQLDTFGSFVCHSAVVELVLEVAGVRVVRDQDRERMVRFY